MRGNRGSARVVEDERSGVNGLGPAPAVELGAGAACEQIEPPEIEAAVGAVLDSSLYVPVYEFVRSLAEWPHDEAEKRSSCGLLETCLQGALEAKLELLAASPGEVVRYA